MERKSLLDLSSDDLLEICKFLSPCDIFRLSQTNRFMYFNQFEISQSSCRMFFDLISKLVSDHLENSSSQKVWWLSDEEKLWMERKIQNRKDWKNLLRVYLRLSYIELMNEKCGECEFLIYQPFGNIRNEMNKQEVACLGDLKLDFTLSEMDDPVLVHGYRDSDGNIKIFNWERQSSKVKTELNLSIPTKSLQKRESFVIGTDTNLFQRLVELWTPYDDRFHNVIRTQEFTIPNRVFKITINKRSQVVYETGRARLNSLQNCPSKILIHTKPPRIERIFSLSTLACHIPFYHDLFSFVLFSWFFYERYSRSFFRHSQELLSHPFRHPYLEGHEMYQYAYFAGFVVFNVLCGGSVGFIMALLPGVISSGLSIFLGRFLDDWEYPESRELRSTWNLLAFLEVANMTSSVISTFVRSENLLLWADTWKNSILEYFNSKKRKE